MTQDLLDRATTPVEQALKDAGLDAGDIERGASWSAAPRACPPCRTVVQKLTGKEPNMSVNPDEVVAMGAAVQGARAGRRRRRTSCCST